MLLELLKSNLSGSVVNKIGKTAGVDSATTQTVLGDVLPAILGGLALNAQSRPKEADLTKALQEDHTGELLNNPEIVTTAEQIEDGQKILEHVFGENQNQVLNLLTQKLGVDKGSIASIMSMAAPLVLEQLGHETVAKDASVSVSQVLQQERPQIEGALGDLAQSFFDTNKNGSVLDELLSFFRRLIGR